MYQEALPYEDRLPSTSHNSGYPVTVGTSPTFTQIALCHDFCKSKNTCQSATPTVQLRVTADDAGNFQRQSAISTICNYSDCTVAYSEEEFKILSNWAKEVL